MTFRTMRCGQYGFGRGCGCGRGRRQGFRARSRFVNQGQDNTMPGGSNAGGSSDCVCSSCGYTEPHQRGIPCSERQCPTCNKPLKGAFCR